jgi:CYTH domain-containing protein
MALEIERKFLVDHGKWAGLSKPGGVLYRQGYILTDENKTIRVRAAGTNAFLTIKGKTTGATRNEFEYEIPLADAVELLDLFPGFELTKTRYKINHKDKLWEVDVFHGANEGLIVAEIELGSEEEKFDLPDWVTSEVTEDAKYYNSNLVSMPFTSWAKE